MQTDKLLYRELSYELIGILYRVHKKLGCGFPEKVYQRVIEIELEKEEIPFEKEKQFNVLYEGRVVGRFRLDLIVDSKIVLEIKAVERIPKVYKEQLVSYLKATPFQIGLLVNFGSPKLEYVRLIRSKSV